MLLLSGILPPVLGGRSSSSPTRHHECRRCGSTVDAGVDECVADGCPGGIAVYRF